MKPTEIAEILTSHNEYIATYGNGRHYGTFTNCVIPIDVLQQRLLWPAPPDGGGE